MSQREHQVSGAVQQVKKQGGKILFHAGEIHYASSDLFRDNLPDLLLINGSNNLNRPRPAEHKNEGVTGILDKFKEASHW